MSVKDTYKTLSGKSEGLYKEKGSKFIARAFHIQNLDEIKLALQSLREEFHDARHHCYAWRLGPKGEPFRSNDDGEPSNSAGKPILGQLVKYELTNSLIVIIRYFGGTKLGVGGLISAYKKGAEEAILAGKIIEKQITEDISITYNYTKMNDVMNLVKRKNLNVVKRDFQTLCEIVVRIRLSESDELKAILENSFGLEWKILS